MIIYSGTKKNFMDDEYNGELEGRISEEYYKKLHRHPSISELHSWQNSYSQVHIVLNDSEIPDDAGVAIEYNIPATSKRIDFMISGYDENNHPNIVIIELKQWNSLEKVEGPKDLVKTVTGSKLQEVEHPSSQVANYANFMKDYNQSIQDGDIDLLPCAYLHNYQFNNPDPALDIQYQFVIAQAPLFGKSDRKKLADFIKKYVKKGDNLEILYEVDNGKIRPSKSLQDMISSMLKGNKEFIMLDDQKIAYENILYLAKQCKKDHVKRTIVVQGGPGTGKSVIAINLLAELTKNGMVVQYTSKNQAPRDVYSTHLKGDFKKKSIDNLFKGAGSYVNCQDSEIDALIADEAHRLLKQNVFYKGKNQIKDIIHASLCSIFFIDESQRISMEDIGSIAEIEQWANSEGSEVSHYQLNSQFRCNGSDGYLAWIDDVLEIRQTANFSLEDMNYDIQVFDSPSEVYEKIKEKNKINNKSRMVAGYCWEWDAKGKNNSNVHEVVIGDFEMSWNLNNGVFAIDDYSIEQIGCIHTVQGLEFDYVGVIIGDDMRYKSGHIITDYTKRASTDLSLKGIKKLAKKDSDEAYKVADEIIKNTYRTLMTRGMKGCYIYCTDKALSNYLKERLEVK